MARILNLYHEAKDMYERRMVSSIEEEKVVYPEASLEDLHQEQLLAALASFQTSQGLPLSVRMAEDLRKVLSVFEISFYRHKF